MRWTDVKWSEVKWSEVMRSAIVRAQAPQTGKQPLRHSATLKNAWVSWVARQALSTPDNTGWAAKCPEWLPSHYS